MSNNRPPLAPLYYRQRIETLLEACNRPEAIEEAIQYWAEHPNASSGQWITAHFDKLWAPETAISHRVAFVRSFTIEPIIPLLQSTATLKGCRLIPWVGEFNAYAQEILDPDSALYAHQPDSIILALQSRDVAPSLWSQFVDLPAAQIDQEINDAAALVAGLVAAIRQHSSAHVVVHGLERPLWPSAGLFDSRHSLGQLDAFAAINLRIRELCANQHNIYWLDYDDLQARHGRLGWHSEKKWATAKLPLSVTALPKMAEEWWRYLEVLAMPPVKVLLLDLDDTLWGGTVGEDGLGGIKISRAYPGLYFRNFQRAILDIRARGILLAVVSKNNEQDALEVLQEHPEMILRPHHFAALRINWLTKPDNIVAIAQELGLGLQSFAFFDDNPAERDSVKRILPQVKVIDVPDDPSAYAACLRSQPMFERFDISHEDRFRNDQYAAQAERKKLMVSSESKEDFLFSLQTEIEIKEIDNYSLVRSAQLTQKTNQFNVTTKRYSEAQISTIMADPTWQGFTLQATDRFGDNGIVGLALLCDNDQTCEIDTFLLSCRVLGRSIEIAFLAILAEKAKERCATRLAGWFIPTAKNGPAASVYPDAGFQCGEQRELSTFWFYALNGKPIELPRWITIRTAQSKK